MFTASRHYITGRDLEIAGGKELISESTPITVRVIDGTALCECVGGRFRKKVSVFDSERRGLVTAFL